MRMHIGLRIGHGFKIRPYCRVDLLSVGTKPRRRPAQHSLTVLRDPAPHHEPSLRYEPVVYHDRQVCPYCRHSNAATANFCNQCGARLHE